MEREKVKEEKIRRGKVEKIGKEEDSKRQEENVKCKPRSTYATVLATDTRRMQMQNAI